MGKFSRLARYGCRSNRPSNLVGDLRDWRRCRVGLAFHYFMRLPLQLVSLLSLKLAVPAGRITGTFQTNSVDGTSSALMGGSGQARWVEERGAGFQEPSWGSVSLAQRGTGRRV